MAIRMNAQPSVVEYFYETKEPAGHRCGYCSDETGFITNGLWAHRMTCMDYKNLIDRGWRRSGKYCYKPQNDKMCCPLYAISCDTANFVLSKSQKKILIKFKKYLDTGSVKDPPKDSNPSSDQGKLRQKEPVGIEIPKGTSKQICSNKGDIEEPTPVQKIPVQESSSDSKEKETSTRPVVPLVSTSSTSSSSPGHDSLQDQTLASSLITDPLARDKKKHSSSQLTSGASPTLPSASKTGSPEQMKPAFAKKPEKTGKKAETPNSPTKPAGHGKKTVKSATKEQPYKKAIEDFITVGSPDIGRTHQWSVNLVKSAPPGETFSDTAAESYAVYKKYQMAVHHDAEDKCTEKQYKGFLVDSPLQPSPSAGGSAPDYGSYHCQHFIDGRLFMVGVVDILPGCLSSVYLYYDPEFAFLSPGTLAALYEIAFTRKLTQSIPDLTQYYLGYYVHNCQKMRYKANFAPSFLLCPETYRWQPIDKCMVKLDQNKYSRLDEDPHCKVDDVVTYLQTAMVLFQQQALPFGVLMSLSVEKLNSKVTEYAALVGQVVVSSMLLYLDESDISN